MSYKQRISFENQKNLKKPIKNLIITNLNKKVYIKE